MRLLLTTDTVGGVWQFTAGLAASLCGEHDVCLVSFGRPLSPDQDHWVRGMRTVQDGFFTFHASTAPLEWMPDNHRTFTPGAALLDRIARDFRPDIFHSSQFCWGALRNTPGHALASVPTLLTAHSDVLSWAAACRPGGLEPSPWLSRHVDLVQSGLSAADAVAAPTHWMLQALKANFRLPAHMAVVPNGASVYPAPRSSPPPPARKLQAVTAGRLWDEGKNLALLRDVDAPMPLLVAGGSSFGPASAAIPESTQALGPMAQGDLFRLFLSSSLYICTSRYEPFGLAPLEAALHGCALLLNDLPSLREVWGEAALYFDGADSLTHHLRTLNDDPNLLRRAAERVASRAAELSLPRMAKAYGALYRELTPATPNPAEVLAHAG